MSEEKKFTVGYGKPPQHSQFKPGQSGNPKGRPKKRASFTDSFQKELDRRVTMVVDGKSRSVSLRDAIVMQLTRKASAGDLKSMQLLFKLCAMGEVGSEVDLLGLVGAMKEIDALQEAADTAGDPDPSDKEEPDNGV